MSEETTPLSIDQGIDALLGAGSLNSNDEHDDGADLATDHDEEISQDDPDDLEIDDEEAGEDLSGDDVEDEDDTEEGEDDLPPIDVPPQWDDEAAEEFRNLPRKIQELITEREAKARSEIGRRSQQAAEHVKAAENEAKALAAHRAQVEQVLSQVQNAHADKWAGMTDEVWAQWLREDPQNAVPAKMQYDLEEAQLGKLQETHKQQQHLAYQQFLHSEAHRLLQLGEADPVTKKLIDPQKGQEQRQKVAQYLLNQGIDAERLNYVAANELSLAHKAMLYDELVAKQASKKNGVPVVNSNKQPQTTTRQRAPSVPSRPQGQVRVEDQMKKLSKTGSIDDAVNLLLMQSNSKKRK